MFIVCVRITYGERETDRQTGTQRETLNSRKRQEQDWELGSESARFWSRIKLSKEDCLPSHLQCLHMHTHRLEINMTKC